MLTLQRRMWEALSMLKGEVESHREHNVFQHSRIKAGVKSHVRRVHSTS